MNLLSILIVSYNTKDMTLECLKSVFEQTSLHDFEVIVLDNNSSDGSAEAIEAMYPQVKLIKLSKNIGFAKGNNQCSLMASGSYLLLLNPDTIILDNAIDKLLGFAVCRPDAGIWGGRTLFSDRSLNPGSCWRKLSVWNLFCRAVGLSYLFTNSPLFNSEAYGGWYRDSIREVDIVVGCFFLIRKRLWEQLEGFSDDFFMYGEEADMCMRAKKIGCRPTVTNEAEIIHYGGASEKNRSDKLVRILKAKNLIIRKHWSKPMIPIGEVLLASWPFFRVMTYKIALISFFGKKKSVIDGLALWKDVWCRSSEWKKEC